jgi:hypothetical protein
VKRILAAVFQSAPLLQSKFWTCLYASIRARAAASARAFALAAASASMGALPSPPPEGEVVEEERRGRRDETRGRWRGRSAGRSIASSRVVTAVRRAFYRRRDPSTRRRAHRCPNGLSPLGWHRHGPFKHGPRTTRHGLEFFFLLFIFEK